MTIKGRKILHITNLYPSEKGPYLGSFMLELHKGLDKKTDTHFLIPTPFSFGFKNRKFLNTSPLLHKKAKRIQYLSIPRRKLASITRFNLKKNILPFIQKGKYDLIHFHWAFPEMLALPEISKLGIPIFLTFHGHLFHDIYANKTLRKYLREAVSHSDRVFMVGKKLREQVCAHFPEIESKSYHLPNGIDETKFTISDKLSARKSLDWNPAETHILCVANIAKEKGVDVLVNAVAHSKELQSCTIHIIGRVIDETLFDEMNSIIASFDLKNIHLTGPVPHSLLSTYYQASDLFVLPSRSEGFGVALVEAGMCGLPLVSTFSGGPEEIILPENGTLVESENPEALANGILSILNETNSLNPEIIRKSMVERYSQTSVTDKLLNHYKDFIE